MSHEHLSSMNRRHIAHRLMLLHVMLRVIHWTHHSVSLHPAIVHHVLRPTHADIHHLMIISTGRRHHSARGSVHHTVWDDHRSLTHHPQHRTTRSRTHRPPRPGHKVARRSVGIVVVSAPAWTATAVWIEVAITTTFGERYRTMKISMTIIN